MSTERRGFGVTGRLERDPILTLVRIAPAITDKTLAYHIDTFVHKCDPNSLNRLKVLVQRYQGVGSPEAKAVWTRRIYPILTQRIDRRIKRLGVLAARAAARTTEAARLTLSAENTDQEADEQAVRSIPDAMPEQSKRYSAPRELRLQTTRLEQWLASTAQTPWRDVVRRGLHLGSWEYDDTAEETFDVASLMLDRAAGTFWDLHLYGAVLVKDYHFGFRHVNLWLKDGGELSFPLGSLQQLKPLPEFLSEEEQAELRAQIEQARRARGTGGDRRLRLSWRLLPNPPTDPIQFRSYLERNFGSGYATGLDLERLEWINSLGPSRRAVGLDEFDGYIAFLFDEIVLAVLDCPRTGNAIYLLEDQWEALSRLPKRELINAGVKRVIHKGSWRERLKNEIWLRRRAYWRT